MPTRPLIVFDVNETLLDLAHVSPIFARIFARMRVMRLWFANLILYSCALTVAESYVPFTDIGAAVLEMLARTRGIEISPANKAELTKAFSEMPLAPPRSARCAGPPARQRLRLFTLTDNLLEVQTHQLEHGGIVDRFERRFSVDQTVHRHKPAPETYGYVARELGAKPADMLLIASHTWDTLGAVGAGWQAALIRRPGNDLLGVGPQPQFVGANLAEVADQLIARFAAWFTPGGRRTGVRPEVLGEDPARPSRRSGRAAWRRVLLDHHRRQLPRPSA